MGLEVCKLIRSKKDDAKILIVVPTEVLKNQWLEKIEEYNLSDVNVEIINTVIKHKYQVDLLVQDEVHRYASQTMREVFNCVTYSMVLCLTGTLERLDGKEEIIKKYAPVCDIVTKEEAITNGWLSAMKQYVVLLDVDNLDEYEKLDRKFNSYFSMFDFKFDIFMKCLKDRTYRSEFAKLTGIDFKSVTTACYDCMRCLHARKKFIESHSKKLEIANLILSKRKDKKCIVFASKIEDLKHINVDYVLHSKQTKKSNASILNEFNELSRGSIGSSKMLNEGLDCKGLSVGIVLNTNSSKIQSTQQIGRVIRAEEGKTAEVFTILINKTKELSWFANSSTTNPIYVTEDQLNDVLDGKEIHTRQRNLIKNIENRF